MAPDLPSPTTASLWRERRRPPQQNLKQKLLLFEIGSDRYVLSLTSVQRIIDQEIVYADLAAGPCQIQIQGQPITVLDPAHLLDNPIAAIDRSHLILCQLSDDNWVGLPVPHLPKVIDVAIEHLQTLPDRLPVVSQVVQLAATETAIVLDLEQLI